MKSRLLLLAGALVVLVNLGEFAIAETESVPPAKEPALPLPGKTPPPGEPSDPPPAPQLAPLKQGPDFYEKLTTKNGAEFFQCKVLRAVPSGLVVEHTKGVARLSFFDLPETVQKEWGFDPFAAMDHFKAEEERERQARWRMFWEKQQYESEQARLSDEERLRELAEREWIPIEATVISRADGGETLVALCRRVVFEKTKKKSTLGFEIDGPLRRSLVLLKDDPLLLKMAIPGDESKVVGQTWKGYLDPVSKAEGSYVLRGGRFQTFSFEVVAPKAH